jgi:hypothetical protein
VQIFLAAVLHPIFSPPTKYHYKSNANKMTKAKNNKKEYHNQFTINRDEHKSGYTVISNHLVRDERLDALDKGIMLMILANDSTKYVLNTTVLHKSTGLGKTSFYGSIEKLRELGYINKERFQGGVRWIINEIPAPNGVLRNSDSQVSGSTEINTTESGTTEINTTEINTTESGTTENRTLISNNNLGESAEALPPLAEEKPIEEEPIEKKQIESLTNRSCNNKSGEQGDLDLGGGVPVSVPLAAPPLGSLAPPTPTHTPSIDNSNEDDITLASNPVITYHTPIRVEERSEAKKSTTNTLVNHVPSFHYSPAEISSQIENYLRNNSKFFFGDNQNLVANTYEEFYKEYPTTVATIGGYEQVLYLFLKSALSTMDKFIENTQDLNNTLDNTKNLVVSPSDVMNLMNFIKADKKGSRNKFKKLIADAANIQADENL